MQNPSRRIPIWLILVYVFSLATLLAWPFVAFMSAFAFDAPGSANDPSVWTIVIVILLYPLLPIVGVVSSFFTYRKGRKVVAYILAAVGAIPLLIIVLALASIFVSDLLIAAGVHF